MDNKALKTSIDVLVGDNDTEIIRLTISIGIVAAAIGLWVILDSIDGTTLLKIIDFFIAFISFSFIMLTGLRYTYGEDRTSEDGLLKCLREKAYNISMAFFWWALFTVIFLLVVAPLHLTAGQTLLYSFFVLAALFILMAIFLWVRLKVESKRKIASGHE